jgi:hypothetical protein
MQPQRSNFIYSLVVWNSKGSASSNHSITRQIETCATKGGTQIAVVCLGHSLNAKAKLMVRMLMSRK